jgi:hypothetical protein
MDQVPTEGASPTPNLVLTDDHVQILKRYSSDNWKFLVSVVVLDVTKSATVDQLDAFFATFPNADQVEERGWFDVFDCLDEIGLAGGEFLSRYIARTSYDFIAAHVVQQPPFSLEFISQNFARKNAFWEVCHRVAFDVL